MARLWVQCPAPEQQWRNRGKRFSLLVYKRKKRELTFSWLPSGWVSTSGEVGQGEELVLTLSKPAYFWIETVAVEQTRGNSPSIPRG